jgi:hypothetical protein
MGGELFREVGVQVLKVKGVERLKRLRLYCVQARSWWALQIRGPVSIGGGEGKDFIVANASLSKEDMAALRDEIDRQLGEARGGPTRDRDLLDRALKTLEHLREVSPCRNNCARGDTTCASEAARMVLNDARERGYLPF